MYIFRGWNKLVAELLCAPQHEKDTHLMSILLAVALIITVFALNY